jgi:hypothetical protein
MLIPLSIVLVFPGILPANYISQGESWLCLHQVDLYTLAEETNVSLQRKPSVLEAEASSTWFLCEN